MGGMILGLLAMLGLAGAAVLSRKSETSTQPPKPALPPAPPPPPPTPRAPAPLPAPSGPQAPPLPSPNSTAITADGTKVFRPEVVPAILPMLDAYGVEPVEGNPLNVRLVPRSQPFHVTARQWTEAYAPYAIAAVEWLGSPHEPKYLRAVAPDQIRNVANAAGFYAILTGPVIIAQTPSIPYPPMPAPGPMPAPAPNTPYPSMPAPFPPMPTPMPAPLPAPTPQASPLDELPSDLRKQVDSLLAGTNAAAMGQTAQELEKAGYAKSAQVLRARMKDVELSHTVENTSSGRTYTVHGKELPSEVAAWYTGDGNRWRELLETNSNLRIRKVGEIEYLLPWKSGMMLVLPNTWDVKRGPMPVTSRQSKAAPPPK